MSKEEEIKENLRREKAKQQEGMDNLRALGRRQTKSDKVRIMLSQALSQCGEGRDLEEVRRAIGTAISKLDYSSKKTFQKFEINKQMVELAKTKQSQWWKQIEAGLGLAPKLELPELKKEIQNDIE